MTHTKVEVTRAEWDTVACQHVGLRVFATIDGTRRIFFLRTSETSYPGNDVMIEIIDQVVKENLT